MSHLALKLHYDKLNVDSSPGRDLPNIGENKMALEPGDIVQLKSGGPLMTVVALEKSDVRCIWHSASAEALCSALIPAAALDHIDLADDEDLEDEEEED
jgi:uncharacterized protein YodC (DUF2158 family)